MEVQYSTTIPKHIRPLPRVPTTPPAQLSPTIPPTSTNGIYRRRPLPEPPMNTTALPSYSAPPLTPFMISVTPPTPPYSSSPSSSFRPFPSQRPERPKNFKGLLKVQTSPEVLLCSVDENSEDRLCSPLTPAIPRAPSPSTARRRRISKLRRQLGAGVPSELILTCPMKQPQCVPPPLTREVIEVEDSDDEDSDVDADTAWTVSPSTPAFRIIEHKEVDDYVEKILPPWTTKFPLAAYTKEPANQRVRVPSTTQRHRTIKKWVWDKGGKRRDEQDYSQILQQLRKL